MTDLFQEPEDATPLEPQEREGLLQSWITHRNDLNEAEQENIVKGAAWVRGRRHMSVDRMLTGDFIRTLHRRMFGEVWQWAGRFRARERNIGLQAYRIPVELAALLADVRYWVEHETFATDEIAIRFHHRLVAIHPFPNGNGRHARLAADLLVERLNEEPFSWGSGSLSDMGELRRRYVAALQAADNHDIGPLLEFARS
ncbi:mobile mystery protein B [Rhizobium lentis]|uniref:Fic-DOC domain mobile mystery protein B n=1 Tax=Rhizobium lentis TaxID=1138194 RepID=A0A7W8XH16_9HYPH|nr:mobile mystery protein B [Rhizobium lentis]MBB4575785.1 Fic-DOC domain mobile mystery protein B [Rhizobium lentis]MBB5552152.1 Fic-DOC domain mobile mystery protein B [Rhizobium lentis]MBB5562690.1 Fic-DOC domain mobile mystery protein B [Rhizobium lentis]MBB5569763.1 Fic-DOC domain mobile mystery protein B [Rhizobium lentis]